mmetsp:Transcript_33399/g.34031  ORF Transcript_33399/g.34031 Transcript_33399/m.34031 type:complete len:106 (+) Transcript_33399:133-450(+)
MKVLRDRYYAVRPSVSGPYLTYTRFPPSTESNPFSFGAESASSAFGAFGASSFSLGSAIMKYLRLRYPKKRSTPTMMTATATTTPITIPAILPSSSFFDFEDGGE